MQFQTVKIGQHFNGGPGASRYVRIPRVELAPRIWANAKNLETQIGYHNFRDDETVSTVPLESYRPYAT